MQVPRGVITPQQYIYIYLSSKGGRAVEESSAGGSRTLQLELPPVGHVVALLYEYACEELLQFTSSIISGVTCLKTFCTTREHPVSNDNLCGGHC